MSSDPGGGPGAPGLPAESGESGAPGGADHDATGLELARLIARQIGASLSAASRPRSGGPPRRRRVRDVPTSGAHPDDRDPQALGSSVRRLVDDHGWDVDLRVHGVVGRWDQIVGPGVAEHCRPESFAGGRLVVRTDSTAWATQLRLLAADVVRRLNEELGDGTVTFVDVEGPTGPSWKKGRLGVRGRGPRDTYG